jgi:hypothetical protein
MATILGPQSGVSYSGLLGGGIEGYFTIRYWFRWHMPSNLPALHLLEIDCFLT